MDRAARRRDDRDIERIVRLVEGLRREAVRQAQRLSVPLAEVGDDVGPPRPASATILGWHCSLSLVVYGDGQQGWHFSAQLYPRGRSSVEADWGILGRITAAVGTPREPLLPIEDTDPNAPHHYTWFDPETETSRKVVEKMRTLMSGGLADRIRGMMADVARAWRAPS